MRKIPATCFFLMTLLGTGIGLRYRFGSAFNNIVNPRFTNGRY